MKFKKKIGILGGMGPLASCFLYKKIIMQAQVDYQAVQDFEFPEIILHSIGLKGFDETGIVDYDQIKKQLVEGVKVLEKGSADFIIVNCNTVHIFFDDLSDAVDIPILHLIDETVKHVSNIGVKKVGFIASETTNELGLYNKALNNKGIECVKLVKEEQELVNKMILNIMVGKNTKKDSDLMYKFMNKMIQDGAEAIILGCTELPMLISKKSISGVSIFDSVEIISKVSLEYSLG